MKKLLLFLTFLCLSTVFSYSAGTDLIIQRNGTISTGTLVTVSDDSVYYLVKQKGEEIRRNIETTKVFMVKRAVGYDFFFDRHGKQRVVSTIPIKENDVTLYLRVGKYFPIYNMTIENDRVLYQMQDKKKAPQYMSTKEEILLIRYPDGTTTTFMNPVTGNPTVREVSKVEQALKEKGVYVSSNIQFESGKAELEPTSMDEILQVVDYMKYYPDAYIEVSGHTDSQGAYKVNIPLSRQRAETVVSKIIEEGIERDRLNATGKGASEPIADNDTEEGRAKNRRVEFRDLNFNAEKAVPSQTTISSGNGRQLLASAPVQTAFCPTPSLSPVEIETKVNEVDPYTLYRKGSVAEYAFEYKGKQTRIMNQSIGPTYFNQVVADEKIENGLLVAYVRMEVLNKNHEPMKGIPSSFKELYFPTEIDITGTYHFTHNPIKDVYRVKNRQGYGMMIPGEMQVGSFLQCSRMHDVVKGGMGDIVIDATYDNWQVVGEEKITTPAGTFDCMKLKGHLDFKTTEKMFTSNDYIVMWMARGIGVVRYEEYHKSDYSDEPFVYYLNRVTIK
ncbi:MAG: OmpA family protein [Prevotella sp.]|nr:OmpA family protein [Prevotella sp.]MBQ9237454.1 OmpA family protein [Prevotella sp.]